MKYNKSNEPQGQSPAPAVDASQSVSAPSPSEDLEDSTVKGRTKSLTEHMVQVIVSNAGKQISISTRFVHNLCFKIFRFVGKNE